MGSSEGWCRSEGAREGCVELFDDVKEGYVGAEGVLLSVEELLFR